MKKNMLSLKYPELVLEWHPTKNGDLTPDDVSFGSNKIVWWLCLECKYEWKAQINSRTNGNGCPNCNQSKGEKEILKWLNDNFPDLKNRGFLEIVPQKRFENCRDKNPLPFDFALKFSEDKWVLIEYHGKQHYSSVDFFGGKEFFRDRRKKDKIKEKYCKDNKMPLLIIPYWDFENISFILRDTLL